MKKGLGAGPIIFFGSLALCGLGFGQIIENPAKPIANNAGRIVTLKEELRIEDVSGKFFFKETYALAYLPEGVSSFRTDRNKPSNSTLMVDSLEISLKKARGPAN